MKCRICNGEYVNLGVHVQKKHMSCDDYRRMFDIPLLKPLADPELCETLSVSALQRLEDPEWLAKCRDQCAANAGKSGVQLNLPAISKRRLIAMNKATGESYRAKMIPAILADYMSGMSPTDIRHKHGVSQMTLRGWMRAGYLPSRKKQYVFEKDKQK
jgi:hypothetical protein